MQLEAIAGEKAIQDAKDQHQNRGFREEGGDAMGGDFDELFEEISGVPSEGAMLKGGRSGWRKKDEAGG